MGPNTRLAFKLRGFTLMPRPTSAEDYITGTRVTLLLLCIWNDRHIPLVRIQTAKISHMASKYLFQFGWCLHRPCWCLCVTSIHCSPYTVSWCNVLGGSYGVCSTKGLPSLAPCMFWSLPCTQSQHSVVPEITLWFCPLVFWPLLSMLRIVATWWRWNAWRSSFARTWCVLSRVTAWRRLTLLWCREGGRASRAPDCRCRPRRMGPQWQCEDAYGGRWNCSACGSCRKNLLKTVH